MTGERGAADVLQALHRLARWRLDALRGALAEVVRRASALDEACRSLDDAHRALATPADAASGRELDPLDRLRVLGELGRLQQRLASLRAERDARDHEASALRRALHAQQRRLDALDRHRERRLHEQTARRRQRAAHVSDADVIARRNALPPPRSRP